MIFLEYKIIQNASNDLIQAENNRESRSVDKDYIPELNTNRINHFGLQFFFKHWQKNYVWFSMFDSAIIIAVLFVYVY